MVSARGGCWQTLQPPGLGPQFPPRSRAGARTFSASLNLHWDNVLEVLRETL